MNNNRGRRSMLSGFGAALAAFALRPTSAQAQSAAGAQPVPAGAPCAGRVGRRRQEYSAERRRQTEQSRDPHSHTTIVNPGIGSKVKSTRRVQRRRLRWAPFCRTAPAASTVSASSKWAGRF